MKPSLYQKVRDEDFNEIVLDKKLPAVVIFASETMGGIALLHIIMESLSMEYAYIYFFFIDVKKSGLAAQYICNSKVITFFFKNGAPINHQIGLTSKKELKKNIELLLPEEI